MGESKKIKCPHCRKEGDWFAGPCGPFCSRRCKLLDLGKWLGEDHCISEPLRPSHFLSEEDLEPDSPDRPTDTAANGGLKSA